MNDHTKEIVRLRERANLLGCEFLTWSFLLLDRDDAEIQIKGITKDVLFKQEAHIALGKRLVTCMPQVKEQKTSVNSPILEASHEAFASIRNGHMIESLAISIQMASLSVVLNLHAQDFAITQAQIKSDYGKETLSEDEKSLDEHEQNREEIFLRLAAIDDAERVLNALFEHFLSLRLNEQTYKRELAMMRAQVDKRLGSYLAEPQISDAFKASSLSYS